MSTVYAVGIDFGTSNSCVTYASYSCDAKGRLDPDPMHRPDAITFQNRDTIPIAIFVGGDGGRHSLYGELAEEKAIFYPECTFAGFKLGLGRPGAEGEKAFQLSRQFLTYLRSRVQDFVPLGMDGGNCRVETIVGHPVQWSVDQRELTRRAVEEAGFPNVQIEEESLAALYACLCEDRGSFDPEPGSQILMVDMGGGTTDFAFLQLPVTPGQRPVSTPVDPALDVPPWREGSTSYGGRDLDQLLLAHLGRDWDPELVERERSLLLREVRRFKETFSTHIREGEDSFEAVWVVGGEPQRVALGRDEFEQTTGQYIAHFEGLVRAALLAAEYEPKQISSVILTGGHSRWYFVDQTLRRVFPHISRETYTLIRHSRPEQVVARGLAYLPMVRASGAKILTPVRRAAHSLWVSAPSGAPTGVSTGNGSCPAATTARWEEPALVLSRGQQLPFITPRPLRIVVNQLGLDSREAVLRIRFYSSTGGSTRIPLYERVARFERDFWESLWKRFGTRLPWVKDVEQDQFELLIMCYVDENELLTAEVAITRYFRGKEVAVKRQKLQIPGRTSAGSGTTPAFEVDAGAEPLKPSLAMG